MAGEMCQVYTLAMSQQWRVNVLVLFSSQNSECVMYFHGCKYFCTNDESGLTLTFSTARSNLIPNEYICIGKILKFSFLFLYFTVILPLHLKRRALKVFIIFKQVTVSQ